MAVLYLHLYLNCLPRDLKIELFLITEYGIRLTLRGMSEFASVLNTNDHKTCKELYRKEFSKIRPAAVEFILWTDLYWEAVDKYYNEKYWTESETRFRRNEVTYKFMKSAARGWELKIGQHIEEPFNSMTIGNAEVLESALHKSIKNQQNHIAVNIIKFCFLDNFDRLTYRNEGIFTNNMFRLLKYTIECSNMIMLRHTFNLIRADNKVYSVLLLHYTTPLIKETIILNKLEILQYLLEEFLRSTEFDIKAFDIQLECYRSISMNPPEKWPGLQNSQMIKYLIDRGVIFDNGHMVTYYALTRNLELLKLFINISGRIHLDHHLVRIAARTPHRESFTNEQEYNRFVEVSEYLISLGVYP